MAESFRECLERITESDIDPFMGSEEEDARMIEWACSHDMMNDGLWKIVSTDDLHMSPDMKMFAVGNLDNDRGHYVYSELVDSFYRGYYDPLRVGDWDAHIHRYRDGSYYLALRHLESGGLIYWVVPENFLV